MIADAIPEISKLSPQEKWLLMGELWDEVGSDPKAVPSSEIQKKEIRTRWQEYLENPNDGSTWEEIKERLGKS